MNSKKTIILFGFILSCQFIWGQSMLYKRLLNIERNTPEKLEKIATRYTKLFKKNPAGYFFLSKVHYKKFENAQEDKKKSKHIYECLKLAHKAQKLDKKIKLVEQKEWLSYKEKVKYEAYFYPKETSHTASIKRIKKKYYLFISKGKDVYLLDSKLNLEVPQEQRVDSLFYGLPTGKERVKRSFAEEEVKMLNLINKERKKMGLSILELDSSLSAACRYHAYDMGTQNYFSHTGHDLGADGRLYFANHTFDRIRKFYNKTRPLVENILVNRETSLNAYKGWYNSPGHYQNMFNPENRLAGVGLVHVPGSKYKFCWVFCAAK